MRDGVKTRRSSSLTDPVCSQHQWTEGRRHHVCAEPGQGCDLLVGGKGHRLVKAKVIQQRRQTDSKRIGGDINMNVEISDDEDVAFHGVAVFKEVGEFLEEKRVGKLVLFVGR